MGGGTVSRADALNNGTVTITRAITKPIKSNLLVFMINILSLKFLVEGPSPSAKLLAIAL
jgi:hypothetical protein